MPYPEFNSDCLARLGTRRYRLCQVAAVLNTRRLYPALTTEALVGWINSGKGQAEASHLCRKEVRVTSHLPDGTRHTYTTAMECKECFTTNHCLLEFSSDNTARMRCRAGAQCDHRPPCVLVPGRQSQ